jgi:transposase
MILLVCQTKGSSTFVTSCLNMQKLPTDIQQLQQLVWQSQQREQALCDEITKLRNTIAEITAQLNLNTSQRFGKKSEKTPKGTFNEAERIKKTDPPKHHKKGRKSLPAELEREVRQYTLESPKCECGGELHVCGEQVSEQLKLEPVQIRVIQHKQLKYACRRCEKTSISSKIITAPKPAQPIPGSIASPETLAAVLTAKYCDALPLNRQEMIYQRGGLGISRSTLASWCIKSAALLQPLIDTMQQHLIKEPVACADETTVQVLDEPERTPEQKSYMWVYRSGTFSKQPVVLYDYQPGRKGEYPQTYLAGFEGYLQCDGYQAYNAVKGATLACCWAHARRKFDEALKAQPEKSGKAKQGLAYIQKLYAIERKAKQRTPEERQVLRQQQAQPILDKLKQWLELSQTQMLPKSYLGKAIRYTLDYWDRLVRYVEDGQIDIDNNVTERDIRPFTTGRKNWMFSQSVNGAKSSAVIYSIVMTCRANNINPYDYLKQLLRELPQRAEGADLTDLLPWNVKLNLDPD